MNKFISLSSEFIFQKVTFFEKKLLKRMNEWVNEWRKNLKEICAYVLIDWTPKKIQKQATLNLRN